MSEKIHPELLAMRQQGALVASVIITFTDEEGRQSFDHSDFTEDTQMKKVVATTGALNLSALDDLDHDDRVTNVEPNHMFQLPTDPSMPC